jgi:hypothetical protein
MNMTNKKTLSLALALAVLSACSSAPKAVDTSTELTEVPNISEILTERMIAQLVVAEEAGVKGLQALIEGASSVAGIARADLQTALKAAGAEVGVHYTPGKVLTDTEASAIVNQYFLKNVTARRAFMNSKNDALANAAKQQEANAKIHSNVNMNGVNERKIAKGLYELTGGGEKAKQFIQSEMKWNNFTGEHMVDAEGCLVYKKYDPTAAENVNQLMAKQADVAQEVAVANRGRGLPKTKIAECALQQAAVQEVIFFNETLHHALENIPQVAETVEVVCKTGPKGVAKRVHKILENKPTLAEIKAMHTSSCN